MLVAVVHKRDCTRSAGVVDGAINIVFGNARPVECVDRPVENGRFCHFANELVDLSERRAEQMPFFAVYLFKQRIRLIDFPFKRGKIKGGEIKVRLRVIAKLEAECVRGVNGLEARVVEKIAVEKHGGASGTIGVVFIERSEYREYVFKRAFGRVVEGERNQFSIGINT